MAAYKDFDQQQRDTALEKRGVRQQMMGKVEVVRDMATMKTRFRYIDPNDGKYYTEEVDEQREDVALALQKTVQMLAERTKDAERQRVQDAMEGRDPERADREYCMEQFRYYENMGDMRNAEVWLGRAMQKAKPAPVPPHELNYPPEPAKAPLHKDAHFPTKWITEAIDRAEQSTKAITFTFEREGIVVVAMEAGEKYAVKVTDWQAMEQSKINPLIHAIDEVERKLDILQDLKAKVHGLADGD